MSSHSGRSRTASLSSFCEDQESLSAAPKAVANAATLTEPKEQDRNVSWEAPGTEYGLKTCWANTAHRGAEGRGAQSSPRRHELRWIVGGDLKGYAEKHGETVLNIPASYSEFSEFQPMLQSVDGLIQGYGYGITQQSLERALRVLTGGGRYTASAYHLIPCGEMPWLLLGDEGSLLCSHSPIDRSEQIARTTSISVPYGELEVEEENETALTAIRRVAALLAGEIPKEAETALDSPEWQTNIQLSDHVGVPDPTATKHNHRAAHEFESEDGESVRIKQDDLGPLGTMGMSRTVPTTPLESGNGATEIDDWSPDTAVGEESEHGIVVGHSFHWEQYDYSPEAVAVGTTYHLEKTGRRALSMTRTHSRLATVPSSHK